MTHEQPTFDLIKLRTHLESKWHGTVCPLCRVSKWQVQDRIFELRQFEGPSLNPNAPLLPIIPVTCMSCGNTALVHAVVAGVMPSASEQR